MKTLFFIVTAITLLVSPAFAQIPNAVMIQILKAEDERRYDNTLEQLMKSGNPKIRIRAVLAAGRIGKEEAVPALSALLDKDSSVEVRAMAAFALGEIESIKAADAILTAFKATDAVYAQAETRPVGSVSSAETRVLTSVSNVKARLVEAAGKIAAANPKEEKSKLLTEAILDTLEVEDRKGAKQNRHVILLGLTAALRAAPKEANRIRPDKTDSVVAKFLTSLDARIRADAANTLSRIRAKNANETLRKMLAADTDPIARANAARALGAAEDKEAFIILLEAATEDNDSRVRVSAIRSLGAIRDAKVADKLLDRGKKLLTAYKQSKFATPNEKNELLEISTALGRLLANSGNEGAVAFLTDYARTDNAMSSEIAVARLRISQARGDGKFPELIHWRQYSTMAQLIGEFATLEPVSDEGKKLKAEAPGVLRPLAQAFAAADPKTEAATILAAPDVLRSFAKFKTPDLGEVLRTALKNDDVFIRAAAAELLADLPASQENVDMLKRAFNYYDIKDVDYDDARLAILDALFKLDKQQSVETLLFALDSPDYLVRKKAFELLATPGLQEKHPELNPMVSRAIAEQKDRVLQHGSALETKLGQVLNADADYKRAAARKNGSVKAVLATEKGTFTIDFLPEDAPLTVDNFVKLAKSGYFNGLEVHRVVPNFVMQEGDPRGDGNGGPGWSIRCEINIVPFERGVVGMALSGTDTGGSQWFVTHSPQPHLDGGYTVFGRVNETGMKVVDNIVRGDKIISVRIVEGNLPRKGAKGRKR